MLKNLWNVKVVRFGCVGALNTVTDVAILNMLVFLVHMPTLVANLVSSTISISLSYFWNHHIVFRKTGKHSLAQFGRFFLVTGFGIIAIQSTVIYVVIHVMRHYEPQVAQFISTLGLSISIDAFELNVAKILAVGITMVWNFVLYHYIIFNRDGDEELDKAIVA